MMNKINLYLKKRKGKKLQNVRALKAFYDF